MTLTTPACVWEWFCYRVTGYLDPCVRIRLKLLAGESCLERIRGIEEDLGIYMYVSSVRYQTLFTAWKKGGVIRGFWGRVMIRFTWIPPFPRFSKILMFPSPPLLRQLIGGQFYIVSLCTSDFRRLIPVSFPWKLCHVIPPPLDSIYQWPFYSD